MKKDTWALVLGIIAFLTGYFTNPESINLFSVETTKAILMVLQIGGGIAGVIGGVSVGTRAAKGNMQ